MMKKIISLIISCVLLGHAPHAQAEFGFFKPDVDVTDGKLKYTNYSDFDNAYAELFAEESPKDEAARKKQDDARKTRDKALPNLSDYAKSLGSNELGIKDKITLKQTQITKAEQALAETRRHLANAETKGKTKDVVKYEEQVTRDIVKLEKSKEELDGLKDELATTGQKLKTAKDLFASQEYLETENKKLNGIEPHIAALNNRKKKFEEYLQKATSETRKKELAKRIKDIDAEIAKIGKEAKALEKKLYGIEPEKATTGAAAGLGFLASARKLATSYLPSALSSRTGLILGGLGVVSAGALGYLGYSSYRASAMKAQEAQKQIDSLKKQLETALEKQRKFSEEFKKQKAAFDKEKTIAAAAAIAHKPTTVVKRNQKQRKSNGRRHTIKRRTA